jgi:hypothetical protein
MRVLYFYLMKGRDRSRWSGRPDHAAYWRGLGLREYLGGPFTDRWRLITFEVSSIDDAERQHDQQPSKHRPTSYRSATSHLEPEVPGPSSAHPPVEPLPEGASLAGPVQTGASERESSGSLPENSSISPRCTQLDRSRKNTRR